MSLTPAQQRERAIVLLRQAFDHPGGPARVRALQTRLKARKFSEVPDGQCEKLLAEAEKLLTSVEHQPPPPVLNQATALAEFALAVDRVKQSVPDEAAHRRLDWAMQRAMVNPWCLEGCCCDDIEHELEKIAADENLFADYTPEELLANERRLARVVDFEHATSADYFALLEHECGSDLLISECAYLLVDSSLQPIMKRLLRALVSAPLIYRAAVAAICDPRGADTLSYEDFAQIIATIQRREVPERGADGGKPSSPPSHIH